MFSIADCCERQKEIGVALVTWINKMVRLIIISKYYRKYWQLPKMFNAVCVSFSQKFERKWNGEPLWCSYVARWRMIEKPNNLKKEKKKKWKRREKKNATDNNSTKFIILFYVWRLNLWNSILFIRFFLSFVHSILPVNRMWVFRQKRVCMCVIFILKLERTYSMINWFFLWFLSWIVQNLPVNSQSYIIYCLAILIRMPTLPFWIGWEILRIVSWIIPLWIFDWQNHNSFFILFFVSTFALCSVR